MVSLEQIGARYREYIDYLLENKPRVCVHIEPMGELLDEDKLLDFLSMKYFEKRKYLYKFSDYIKALEKEGRAEILMIRRTNVGGMYGEGTSVIAWRPL